MSGGNHRRVSRRAFLGAGAALPWSAHLWSPERAAALDRALRAATDPDGTTLVAAIERASFNSGAGDGYTALRSGAGWPTLPRDDLASPRRGRVDRRVALASIVHLTDVHVIDAQSPGRVEYLDDVSPVFSAAFRPQELLTTQVQAAMVERIRSLEKGPITGRRFDCAVSTGDNIDNQQHNELDWFIGTLDGGQVTPNSGGDDYEGTQLTEWADLRYWHPEASNADRYATELGFPRIDGFLAAAIASFRSPGLDIPWYSTYGNHDGLLQGNLPRTDAIDRALVGDLKVTGTGSGDVGSLIAAFAADADSIPERVRRGELQARTVTPDERRRTITTPEWVEAHLRPSDGPGPHGHGYTDEHLDGDALYYRFEIAPGVVGLSLDTGGYNSGSIGESQLQWLEAALRSVHTTYVDVAGNDARGDGNDHLVVVFSHFTSGTMSGSVDPTRPDERRIQGPELTATLLRYPNVVAWVNGHTHSNSIAPVADPSGRGGGFWEITTASHVDFPSHARIVELVDNVDGTLSIFTTMIEHAAPVAADHADLSAMGLASISRELAANNSAAVAGRRVGEASSLNCELALRAPFDLSTLHPTAVAEPAREADDRTPPDDGSSPLPVALGVGAAAVAAVGGAIAIRRRSGPDATDDAVQPADESSGASRS